jgi:hypothetical protein
MYILSTCQNSSASCLSTQPTVFIFHVRRRWCIHTCFQEGRRNSAASTVFKIFFCNRKWNIVWLKIEKMKNSQKDSMLMMFSWINWGNVITSCSEVKSVVKMILHMSVNSKPIASQQNMKKLPISKIFSFISDVVDLYFRICQRIFARIWNSPHGVFRGTEKTDSSSRERC